MFLAGKNLPLNQPVIFALRNVFGIGKHRAKEITSALLLHHKCKVSELSQKQQEAIQSRVLSNGEYLVGYDLQRQIANRIKHYYNTKTERGLRLARGMPVNGQRSHNCSTAKRRLGQYVQFNNSGSTGNAAGGAGGAGAGGAAGGR
jgi:small subunit ribosomal protein S13